MEGKSASSVEKNLGIFSLAQKVISPTELRFRTPSPLGHESRRPVRKSHQFSDPLDVEFWYFTTLLLKLTQVPICEREGQIWAADLFYFNKQINLILSSNVKYQ